MTETSRGVRYLLVSAVLFCAMSVLAKATGPRIPLPEMILVRGVVSLGLVLWALARAGVPPWGRRRGLLALRGVFGYAALVCYFYGVTHLPIADATVIHYIHPVFTMLLAALLLGERLRGREGLFILGSFVGVVLIVQPPLLFAGASASDDSFALGVALLGAVISACVYVMIRRLRSSDDPLCVVFYNAWLAVLLSAPWAAAEWVMPDAREWAMLVAIGVCTFTYQELMTRGLHIVRAGRATGLGYLQVVLAMASGIVLFDEPVNVLGWVGAAIVATGAGFLVFEPRPDADAGVEKEPRTGA